MVAARRLFSWGVCLSIAKTAANPSLSLDPTTHSLLPAGGLINLKSIDIVDHSGTLEVRGIVGGRRKRFVILQSRSLEEEITSSCCAGPEKPKCTRKNREYLDRRSCKCRKCPNKDIPSNTGFSCEAQDEKCSEESKRPGETRSCCPKGKRIDAKTRKCVDNDQKKPNSKSKGKCPTNFVIDTSIGGQDENTPNPECVPDDSKQCKDGEIPETRQTGDRNGFKQVKCGREPKEKKTCNAKTQYMFYAIEATSDGTSQAVGRCKPTQRYREKKNQKLKEIRPKMQKKWDDEKPQRDAKKAEEDEKRRQKEEEERRKKQEEENRRQQEEKDRELREKKKARIGRCLPLAAFLDAGMADLARKRGAEDRASGPNDDNHNHDHIQKRQDKIDENNPWEWNTEFFDEEWLVSDEVLSYWPSDVEFVDNIEIDNDEFVQHYMDYYAAKVDKSLREQWKGSAACGKNKRCVGKREDGQNEVGAFTRKANHKEKRFFQALPAILSFLGRVASLAVRFTRLIGQFSPRLGNILKDQARMFRLAQPGRGATQVGMRNAAGRIMNSRYFKSCLKGGKPV